MVTEMEMLRISSHNSVKFLSVGLDEEINSQRNVYSRVELLARILDAAARIEKREDRIRRTTRDLRTRVAKCIATDGGIFENLL